MSRVVMAVDPDVGVPAEQLAETWNADAEAHGYGEAGIEASVRGAFFPGPVELVVIPLAVNLASTVLYDLTRRLVARLRERRAAPTVTEELEIVEHVSGADRVLIVRARREVR